MATKRGSGGGFLRPIIPTPVVGGYDASLKLQEPAEERYEPSDVQANLSPSARLDATANLLLVDLTSSHLHWEPMATLLRSHLETCEAGSSKLWAAWSEASPSLPISLHSMAYAMGAAIDSEPVIMYGTVQDTDFDAVAYVAGGGFHSAEVDFKPLDED